MPRQRRAGTKRGSPEFGARVSAGLRRYYARERQALAVLTSDLRALRDGRVIPKRLRPLMLTVAETMQRLYAAAEGEPGTPSYKPLPEPSRVLLEGAGRMLLLGLAEMNRAITADDGESATRAGTLIARFHQIVRDVVGLEGREVDLDLRAYLEQQRGRLEKARENGTALPSQPHGVANGADPDRCEGAAEIEAENAMREGAE